MKYIFWKTFRYVFLRNALYISVYMFCFGKLCGQ